MSLEGIPKILYKYRSFQEDVKKTKRFQRKALIDRELYFASYEQLNDPFDLKIRKKFELLPDEDKLLNITYHLAKKNGDIAFNMLWGNAKTVHLNNLAEDDEIYAKRSIESTDKWLNSVKRGIFCLSKNNDDILMWSHYANSNMGFCMGYNTEKVIQSLFDQKCELLVDQPLKTKYYSEYPALRITVGKDPKDIIEKFLAKSVVWSYENEWRIIIYNLSRVAIPIPVEAIEEIILGSKILPKTEQKILEIQKQKYPNAKVFKVEPDDSEFKLNVLPYNP